MEEQENKAPEQKEAEESKSETVVADPVDNKVLMGILAYLGILVIVSYIVAKDDPFVKYHIKQGLVLLALGIAWWILVAIVWILAFFTPFVYIALLVFAILGIVNVVNKKEKPLPLIGGFAKLFKF